MIIAARIFFTAMPPFELSIIFFRYEPKLILAFGPTLSYALVQLAHLQKKLGADAAPR
jgi:hypothetical protein